MELTITVRQIDNGFRATSGHPVPDVAEAATRDEALARLRLQIERQLENDVEYLTWHFPEQDHVQTPIWPDDELTAMWIEEMAKARESANQEEYGT